MAIHYTDSLDGITSTMLTGFFEGWQVLPSGEKHLRMLEGSRYVVVAIDDETSHVVGRITAISDGANAAYIPMLEVLPAYRSRGIGRELVARMLHELRDYPCIDLMCAPERQQFYERCGLRRSVGMSVREPSRPGPDPTLASSRAFFRRSISYGNLTASC